jgi:anti-sigma factor RsiW
MSDCSNVEMRELLPELLHDALPLPERERLEAHVATCDECTAELEVLRTARRVLSSRRIPLIDTAAIVRSLPRPVPATAVRRYRTASALRIAAAVSVISLGGISLSVARSFFQGASSASSDSALSTVKSGSRGESAVATSQPARPAPSALPIKQSGLTVGGGLSDLGTDDLKTLLNELEKIEPAPAVEPESFSGGRVVTSSTRGGAA